MNNASKKLNNTPPTMINKVGQIMKEMKGKANPASVRETLMKEVEKRK